MPSWTHAAFWSSSGGPGGAAATFWEVVDGELEVTIDGVTQVAKPGVAVVVPPNARHAVRALTDGKAVIVDHRCGRDFD